jgi:hypothetical protein
MTNFMNNDHALMAGYIGGALTHTDLNPEPVWDEDGYYLPIIKVYVPLGDEAVPMFLFVSPVMPTITREGRNDVN